MGFLHGRIYATPWLAGKSAHPIYLHTRPWPRDYLREPKVSAGLLCDMHRKLIDGYYVPLRRECPPTFSSPTPLFSLPLVQSAAVRVHECDFSVERFPWSSFIVRIAPSDFFCSSTEERTNREIFLEEEEGMFVEMSRCSETKGKRKV